MLAGEGRLFGKVTTRDKRSWKPAHGKVIIRTGSGLLPSIVAKITGPLRAAPSFWLEGWDSGYQKFSPLWSANRGFSLESKGRVVISRSTHPAELSILIYQKPWWLEEGWKRALVLLGSSIIQIRKWLEAKVV